MENIVVYLFDIEMFDRDKVENATYKQLEHWFKTRCNNEEVQKFTLTAFQDAFNEEMIDNVNNWIVFATKK